MKTNLIHPLLVGLLLLCTTVNAFLGVRYFFSIKEMEKLQSRNFRNRQILTRFDALLNDSAKYGQKNETILPILMEIQTNILILRTNAMARPSPTATEPASPNPDPGPIVNP